MWRTHSCVPRRHSCRRPLPLGAEASSGDHVLHLFQFFAARDDSAVTVAPEGRQILAQCLSTGNGVKDRRAPERGGRTGAECFFRPVPGLANLLYGPRARALGYSLAPSGLREHFLGCGYAALRGRQSCLQPPFRRLFRGRRAFSITEERRLKAGGSQDWLPHSRTHTARPASAPSRSRLRLLPGS